LGFTHFAEHILSILLVPLVLDIPRKLLMDGLEFLEGFFFFRIHLIAGVNGVFHHLILGHVIDAVDDFDIGIFVASLKE
jgi:hypothetical protein